MKKKSMRLTAYQLALIERALRRDATDTGINAHGDLIAFLERADVIKVSNFIPAHHKTRPKLDFVNCRGE